jgi:tetratricopeptide (TPR) repeat protein/transcriptional regulator with XRE-family HTH domain
MRIGIGGGLAADRPAPATGSSQMPGAGMAGQPGDTASAATADFGALLRTYRVRGLLSQEQLAEGAGLSTRTIRGYEAGRVQRPHGESVRLLADALRLAGSERTQFESAALAPRPTRRPEAQRVWPGVEGVRPCQLPPDVADFVGRAEVVARLRGLLAGRPGAAAVVVSAVAGRAGVGKSALAVHVAHQLTGEVPDGQLYAGMRGAHPDRLDPDAVLGWFLRALGVDGSALPSGVDQRAALYRSLLADRRMLVVLDDAGSEAQVRPLLPGSPGCAVLVTSRARLAGLEGARLVDLELLELTQALELLGRIVGAGEPAAAAELARLCGYLPLALRVAGARLAARPHWRLAQLVDRLADERQRLDQLTYRDLAVRASLALSYQALEPAAQALFRRLGLLQAPDVAAWVAAALLDCPAQQAEEVADRLVDARLLEVAGRDATGQVRYRLHDLVRVYARECAQAADPPAERRAALARALGGWLHLAERADARLGDSLLEPVYGQAARWPVGQATTERLLADPLAWLEAERPGLVAAVTQAASLGMAGVSWELTSALTPFLAAHLHVDDWRRCAAQALAAARRARDARGEAAVLVSLGVMHAICGRLDEALGCWQAALAIFERLADDTGQAMCLAALALLRSDGVTYEQRRQQAEDALALVDQRGGSLRARACVLYCLGLLHHTHGRLEPARQCLEEAQGLHRQLGSRRGEARLLYQLGAVLIKQGRDEQGAGLLQQALVIFQQFGDRVNGTPAELYLATALVHLGRYRQARPLLEPWVHSDFPFVRALALRGLGELDHAQGRHDHARQALHEALRLFGELGIPAEQAATRQALAALADDRSHTRGHPHLSTVHAPLPADRMTSSPSPPPGA